ncbi:MAG: T9SS C-terminal target domain-containing protein [Calditrichaeota bacterium]|nr:MAG: T9SS C-terminal target domain-containing protein [Calditrichota bacterium]
MKPVCRNITFALMIFFIPVSVFAQNINVDIHLNRKHVVGDISEFDREKFITVHSNLKDNDWNGEEDKLAYLMEDCDAWFGRDNGSMGWFLGIMQEDPSKPGYALPSADTWSIENQGAYNRNTSWGENRASRHKYDHKDDVMVGGQERPHWPGHLTTPYWDPNAGFVVGSSDAIGDFMGRYLNDFYRNDGQPVTSGARRPRFLEVINEPLYGLIDDGVDTILGGPAEVFQHHNDVADAIRRHNTDVKIGGYTAAFPHLEEDNFSGWTDRIKLFYDMSGEKMDFISIHIYDFNKHHFNNGTSFDGPINYKGSRVEATFDMMEQYSYRKFGKIIPFIISEYGGRDHSIEWKTWTPYRDWQTLKAISPLMMSFMQRPHLIWKTMPFIVIKAEWGRTNVPYTWRLLRQAFEASGETGDNWVFSELIKFYELWADVNGMRIDTRSDNLDIMVDAYVQGNIAYVILNNLNYNAETVSLNLFDDSGNTVQFIEAKHLYLQGAAPILDVQNLTPDAGDTFTLASEATAILQYTFAEDVTIDKTMEEVKYYAKTYFKPIQAATAEVFEIDNVALSHVNNGVLRIGIGRDHDKSKQPVVLFNGAELTVPDNRRGDNHELRDQFFGLIEIAVPDSLLQANNTVSIEFPDDGGYISSVTIQVFSGDISLGVSEAEDKRELWTYPNPSSGKVTIVFPQKLIHAKLKVYNVLGEKVLTQSVWGNRHELNLQNLAKGVYFIFIEEDGFKLKKKIALY